MPELEQVLGAQVLQASAPAVGRLVLPEAVGKSSHIIFLGSRAVPVQGAKVIFWPLNVAPLEQHVVKMENSSPRNRLRHRLLKRRLEHSVRAADGLVFGSNHARTLYMGAFAAAATRPYIVNRGGAPSLGGVPQEGRGPRLRGGRRLILMVSHLYPYKGILEFVQAVGSVRHQLPDDVEFRVAGADRDRTYAARVHAEVRSLGLQDRLVIKEAAPDEMATLYGRADLAVFASTCENAGSFALYDGLFAGLPTLCSDRSSMPEMVAGHVQFVNPFERQRFGAALLSLVTDERRRRVLANDAGAWAASAPTWKQRAEQLVAFLEQLD
ncbi:glycosyltransferase family 4 protein [Nocardioides sp.]|uniref:glycosyltransferase family 4 protein n=1 Tax=Nocardioides sp. TaxID=35761 RepID=UPI002736FBEE|nr:glycosyltransferase family 4 protein [Nocardioides sp.]